MSKILSAVQAFERLEQNATYLLTKNKDLFKLLIYDDRDPLSHPICDDDIEDAIIEFDRNWQRNPKCRLFWEMFLSEVADTTSSQLRLYPAEIDPIGVYASDIYINVDIIVHQAASRVRGGRRRNLILAEVIRTLNGAEVQLMNPLTLQERPTRLIQFKENFWGYRLIFHTRIGPRGDTCGS